MNLVDRKLVLTALLTGLAGSLPAAQARASCVEPSLELLWTYPSDGAEGVPLNAEFWALTSVWGAEVEATLNGVALSATRELNAVRFAPGSLSPDTEYTLHLSVSSQTPSDGFDVHFRTGSTTASVPAAPDVLGHATSSGLGEACPDVISAQDCFDTGQNTLLRFQLAASDAVAWLVRNEKGYGAGLSPASLCGAPAVFIHGDRSPACYELRSVGPGGLASAPSRFCPEPSGAADGGAHSGAEDSGSESTQDAGVRRGKDDVVQGCNANAGAATPRFSALAIAA